MNIHPIFVHFPIALLTIYSVLELIKSKRLTYQATWFYIKASFLMLGTLGSYAAIITGGMAEDVYPHTLLRRFIPIHESFASTVVIFFTIISLLYLVQWLDHTHHIPFKRSIGLNRWWRKLVTLSTWISNRWLGFLIGLIGLGLISMTGALGGLIAYGPESDPISKIIFNIFYPLTK